ncbi:hypothetical protein ABZ070_36325, partial [Streptomyces sp. NPDC006283]|uniref:hypothetical protein n=1 Tax=Streptomyces sp. NPDC006283 TaxID=3156741 RepID=UPI0033BA9058
MYGKRPLGGFVAAAVVLGAAVIAGPALPGASAAEPSAQVVIPGVTTDVPMRSDLLNVGPHGYLRVEEGRGAVWRSYDGEADVQVDATADVDGRTFQWGTGSDVVAQYREAAKTVELRDMVTGDTVTVALPSGHEYFGTFGRNVLTRDYDSRFHVLDMETGQLRDSLVEGETSRGGYAVIPGLGDADGLVIAYAGKIVWLDVTQRRAVPLPFTDLRADDLALTSDHLLYRANGKVSIFRRDDPTQAERTWPLADGDDTRLLGMVGDELIVARHDAALGPLDRDFHSWRVEAQPMDGTAARTLLARSEGLARATAGGGLLVNGGPNTSDWGVQRIETDGSQRAVATRETRVVSRTVPNKVHRMTFNQGRLTTVEGVAELARAGMYTRTAGPEGGSIVHGDRKDRGWLVLPDECAIDYCPKVQETGDGRIVYGGERGTGPTQVMPLHRLSDGGRLPGAKVDVGTGSSGFVGSWGRWAVVYATASGGGSETRIVDTDTGKVARTLPVHPFDLSGTTLWTGGGSKGEVVGYDIRTGARLQSAYAYIPDCFVEGASVVGRWLHWNCSGRNDEGVYDLQTRTITPLGIGYNAGAQLGDGLVAYLRDDKIRVKDLRDGGNEFDVDAGLPPYDEAWSVDPTTNTLAWADAKGAIRLLGTGVATSALGVVDSDAAASVNVKGGVWKPRWWL